MARPWHVGGLGLVVLHVDHADNHSDALQLVCRLRHTSPPSERIEIDKETEQINLDTKES